MKCMSPNCTCEVLAGRGYCLRHGGQRRFSAEKLAEKRAVMRARAERNVRFAPDGKVRPGQGLGRFRRPKSEVPATDAAE